MSTLRQILGAQLDALQAVMEGDRSDAAIQRVVRHNHEMYGVLRRASVASQYGGLPMNGDPVYRLVLDEEAAPRSAP